MCGFGLVQPLPGIVAWNMNTAITLPVGVESYGAYALGAWLTPGTSVTARTFARRSAIGSLALGVLGQVAYHLLAAEHSTQAPWPVVVLVSCLPVVTLGFGAALTHLLRVPTVSEEADESEQERQEDAPEARRATQLGAPWPSVHGDAQSAAAAAMRATLEAGNPLSGRQLEARFRLTRAEATRVRQAVLAEATGTAREQGVGEMAAV
jgi:hypothetical protein